MASITKTAKGYRVFIMLQGVRKTKTFPNQRDAKEWAGLEESKIRSGSAQPTRVKKTLRQAIEKYRDEVTERNVGVEKEKIRCNYYLKHPELLPLDKAISAVTTEDITAFIKARLATSKGSSKETIKPGSVRRDMSILSGIFEVARKEWKWITASPVKDAKKPKTPKHRNRLITWSEIKGVLRGLGYTPVNTQVTQKTHAVALCFLLALRTGMRSGDMTSLKWVNVHKRHIHVVLDKNGNSRDVPLSQKAVRLVNKMKGFHPTSVFNVEAKSRDVLFRRGRVQQGLKGFTFHDARHTAATWMASKFKSNKQITAQQAVWDLCKIFGWTDTDRALDYYNPDPEDIASRLD